MVLAALCRLACAVEASALGSIVIVGAERRFEVLLRGGFGRVDLLADVARRLIELLAGGLRGVVELAGDLPCRRIVLLTSREPAEYEGDEGGTAQQRMNGKMKSCLF